ncbi:MAG: D-alanyl-D-alanine carboxypeptidase family protein [Planctomycetota bacterium]
MKKILFFILSSLLLLTAPSSLEAKSSSSITAKSYLVIDDSSGRIVTSWGRSNARPIASTTKLLTALGVMRSGSLNDPVRISANAAAQVPSKAGLLEGEVWTRGELLKALLIKSANDAAVALAEDIAGSEAAFCKKITALAGTLGCEQTLIKRASGLNAKGQYSCASDLARISKAAFANAHLRKILDMKECSVKSRDGRTLRFRSHNKLLHDEGGSVPGKTGYTKSSGKCFAGRMIIKGRSHTVVVLGSQNLWGDLKTLRSRAVARSR